MIAKELVAASTEHLILSLLLTISSIPGWRYGHTFLPVIRSPRVRLALGTMCCFAGVVWMRLFITVTLPHLLQLPAGDSDFPVGRVLAAVTWVFTALAMLGGVAYGLEEAARSRPRTTGS